MTTTTTTSTINTTPRATTTEPLGVLVGVSTPDTVILQACRPLSAGEFIVIENHEGRDVLGLVEKTQIASKALSPSNVSSFQDAIESKPIAEINTRDPSYQGYIKIVGYLDHLKQHENYKVVLPSTPISPGTNVYEASAEDLTDIFAPPAPEWLTIGTLLRKPEVPFKININAVYSRHLAIPAKTGMGKTNTVTVFAYELAKLHKTMVIFDYHGDYEFMAYDPSISKSINLVQPRISPGHLSPEQFAKMLGIDDRADKQNHIILESFTDEVRHKKGEDLWNELDSEISRFKGENRGYNAEAVRVRHKIKDTRRELSGVLDADIVGNPLTNIKNGKVNIVNVTGFTESQANAVASFYLEGILYDRKRATQMVQKQISLKKAVERFGSQEPLFPEPVLVVVEEAHIFIPKDRRTYSKSLAERVAREGRKFGLGLLVISQRPRSIDVEILAQMGSMSIMKMISEDDQRQVAAASESLGKDMIEGITSLNTGEAIVAGDMTKIAAYVKIREVEGRGVGGDQKVIGGRGGAGGASAAEIAASTAVGAEGAL